MSWGTYAAKFAGSRPQLYSAMGLISLTASSPYPGVLLIFGKDDDKDNGEERYSSLR